jgi:cytochrome d ubiquinol oxidase subunit II
VGLFGLFRINSFKKDGLGFLFSTLFLIGGFTSTVIAIFPNLLPSTNDVNPSLTIYNAAASAYGLSVGLNWFLIGIVLVAIYFVVQYKIFSGKMDDVDYGEH